MALVVRKPGFRVGPSFQARFSPDGRMLATFGYRVVLWDVESRQRLRSAHPFSHPSACDFSPDGTRLAVKNTSGEIVVLDVETLDVVARHDGRPWGEGSDLLFSPCGEFLVDGSWNGDLVVRDAQTGEIEWHARSTLDQGMVTQLVTTSDRRTWLHDGFGHLTLRPWPFTDTSRTIRLPHTTGGEVALDPTATLLAIRTWEALQVWDLTRRSPSKLADRTGLPQGGTGNALTWAPDSQQLALAAARAIRVFTPDLTLSWTTELQYACHVEYSPSGDLLACGAWSKGFVLARTETT